MSNKRFSSARVTSVTSHSPNTNEPDTHVKIRGDSAVPNDDLRTSVLKLNMLEVLTNGNFESLKKMVDDQQNNENFKQLLPLLLNTAVQVSPLQLVIDIVTNWANNPTAPFALDINEKDEDGNTPLHLAAAQSNSDVIEFLLEQPNINDCAVNNSQLLPFEMCKNVNVAQMMQIKRANYISSSVEEAREAMENGDFKKLDKMCKSIRNRVFFQMKLINRTHLDGVEDEDETLLHLFIQKKKFKVCIWLLDHGADPTLKNKSGQTPGDLLTIIMKQEQRINPELKALHEKLSNEKLILAAANKINEPPTFKGFLKKFTNFAQGYKLRWFILSADGKLSYYKDQASVSKGHSRGTVNLSNCYLHLDSTEKLKFEIIGDSNNTTKWQLKGNHPLETNNWVWSIQSAIRYARDKEMMKKNNRNSNGSPGFVLNRNATQSTISSNKKVAINEKSKITPEYTINDDLLKPSSVGVDNNFSSATSINSNDIGLSDKLTESGKHYVNKMIETRLETSSSTDIAQPKSLDPLISLNSFDNNLENVTDSYKTSKGHHNTTAGINTPATTHSDTHKTYADDDDEEDEDNSDEDGIDLKFEKDEEYLKVEYGPFIEKLNICQKTIGFELDSISDILNNNEFLEQKNPETVVVVRKSLKKVYKLIAEMNKLTSQRDEKLISMLTKQSDVNNVWIQSVRDLEMELGAKSEKLASINRQRKTLKNTLHRKLIENLEAQITTPSSESSSFLASQPESNRRASVINENPDNSSDTLAQIAKFISATKEEDENSDADEFFDAEEATKKNERDDEIVQEANEHESLSTEVISTALNKSVITSEPSNSNSKPVVEYESTYRTIEDEIEEKARREKSVEQDNLKLQKTNSLTTPLIGKTKVQREKEEYLSTEKSFKGYEDGIRKRLKLDEDDRPKISLWAVLKSMVGKDMTKMTLPVSFNEPTSLLQRVTEDLEYSELLDQAASFEDSSLRCLYVAIFTASCYASTTKRVAKPFNPLLGETYEYCRPDKNFRFFTEQVSHHPPVSATWTESPKWDFWGESHVETKFNGRSFGVQHLGLWHIKLHPDNNDKDDFYTYKKPDNTVIGILIGNPQVDNHGEVRITNHVTGDVCILNFKARGWRSSGAFEVRGEVFNKKKEKVWVLGGHWNDSIYAKKVVKGKNGDDLILEKRKTNASSPITNEPNYDGNKFLVWKVAARPDAPFHLTPFAITLNAPQPKLVPWIAPTDTRLRPDQRAMEDGEYNVAATEKHRLEEKQRAVRRQREATDEKYDPKWFVKDVHPITKQSFWRFKGEYWNFRRDKKLSKVSYNIF